MSVDVPAINAQVGSYGATTLKPDYSKVLTTDYDNEVPFTAFMGQIPSEKATGSKFNFFVGRRIPRSTTNNGGTGEGATAGAAVTINVAANTGAYFSNGDMIYAPSSTESTTRTNRYIVISISTDALTCRPNDLTKYAAAQTTGDTLYRFSASMKEGSEGRSAIQTVPTLYTQYIQTFEDYGRVNDQTEFSDTWIQEKEVARITREKRFEHIQNREGAYFLSTLGEDRTVVGADITPRYTQAGLFSLIKTNTYTYGSAMSQSGLYNFMAAVHKPAHSHGNVRYVFASIGAMNQFNKLFTSALRIQPAQGQMEWRVNFQQIDYLGFTWKFILTPTLSTFYDGAAVVVSPSLVGKKTLIPTEFRPNVQIAKANYREFGWRTSDAVKLALEEANGLIVSA